METPQATPTPQAPEAPVVESVGSGPNQVIFEAPVAPVEPVAPAAPVTPEPYRVSELENGQYEVALESGQIYKGTQAEVVRELAKAQYNATRRIAELNGKQPPAPMQQPQELAAGQVDPNALALADLT